uniref:Uncharacterized protein n=1 Tax=Plectus sambesii TaxID=2011161 RepID=A0A914V0T1_9BILA
TTAAAGAQAEDAFQPTTSDASVGDLRMADQELDQNMDWLDLMLPSLPSPGAYG